MDAKKYDVLRQQYTDATVIGFETTHQGNRDRGGGSAHMHKGMKLQHNTQGNKNRHLHSNKPSEELTPKMLGITNCTESLAMS